MNGLFWTLAIIYPILGYLVVLLVHKKFEKITTVHDMLLFWLIWPVVLIAIPFCYSTITQKQILNKILGKGVYDE